jgi:23S rRNA (cytidine1920-2'-O)/16S rRNA (cytidine1409-2'-O)-methyltransferase
VKLAAALDAFAIDPAGLSCLDCGASTGGFTDVLLRRGAAFVHAVDVGSGQFSPALAGPRVGLREGTDIRSLAAGALDPVPSLAAVDVSFISLKLVLPSVAGLLAPACRIVALVKPQFEAGRGNLGKGGVVREASVRERTVEGIADALGALGFRVAPALPSPIAGGDGNVEFLVAAWRDRA